MGLLLELAKETNGIFATFFVLSALVNIYQYKLNIELQNKRLEDWRTSLNLANNLAAANEKSQEAAAIMQQGVESRLQLFGSQLQRIMDKLKLS